MKKILALALFAVALVSCRQTMQTDGFKLSGHLEGLQVGDTLFLKTFLLPDWKEDGTDTILVEKEGIFSAFIPMEHTTFYLLMHQPKMGEPLRSCIRGAEIIARVGDDIKLEGLFRNVQFAENTSKPIYFIDRQFVACVLDRKSVV